jgi:hypothetical protein
MKIANPKISFGFDIVFHFDKIEVVLYFDKIEVVFHLKTNACQIGGPKRNSQIKFCFPYILSPGARIFKILVSTPHN